MTPSPFLFTPTSPLPLRFNSTNTSTSRCRQLPRCCVALVRPVPESFASAILAPGVSPEDISLDLARKQHRAYVNVLQSLVLTYMIPPSHSLPDSVFIEDTAIPYRGRVLIPRPGVESREGESADVEAMLKRYNVDVKHVPQRIEGGDVLVTPRHVFLGKSKRVGEGGKEALEEFFGKEVLVVDIGNALHLKSVVTWVDEWDGSGGFLIAANEQIVEEIERVTQGRGNNYGVQALVLDSDEEYAANTLSQGGYTVMASGYPKAVEQVKARGVNILEVDTSEFRKAQGGLTCLSLIVRD